MNTLAILGYHKVGPPATESWDTWFHVPRATFAAQLETLAVEGWEVIDGAALVRALAGEQQLGERSALITFDDGSRSVLEVALPCLRERGWPAVMFMPTDFIGRSNEFDRDNEPEDPICDWRDLSELETQGVSVQSHGASHRAFSELGPGERRAELEGSRAELERELKRPVEMFAFPYGDHAVAERELDAELKHAGYRVAFGYGGGPCRLPVADPFRLPRIAMGPDTDLRTALASAGDADGG